MRKTHNPNLVEIGHKINYIKYNVSFIFIFLFLTHNCSNYAESRKGVLCCWGPHDGRPHLWLWGKVSQKILKKGGVVRKFQPISEKNKKN